MKKVVITGIVCLIVGLIAGAILRGCTIKPAPDVPPTVIHDTVFRDSIHTELRYITKWKTSADVSIPVGVDSITGDTIKKDTTITVELPEEHRQFKDTFGNDSVKATVNILFSGVNPRIDTAIYTLDVDIPPVVIEKENGFGWFVGVGASVGYGPVFPNSTIQVAPYAGVTVTVGWGYHWKSSRRKKSNKDINDKLKVL